MSRLTDLIAQAKNRDADLGRELEREFKALASRRSFGLNFERHTPETVELPGRPIRKSDKVRVLPFRGSTDKGDKRLWKVVRTTKEGGARVAQLDLIGAETPEVQTVPVEDLIVVAEFRDYIYPGLVSTGKVERGGDKPCHTVINGENFHALEALTFTHRGKVDVIYIELSANPLDVSLAMPRNSLQPTVEVREDGTEQALSLYDHHLLCDENGKFPAAFNSWELEVLARETKRKGFLAWYRNPSSASPESLGITFPDDGQESIMRPDFIFFSRADDGTIQANIIDPHGQHLADSLPKLVGLANYVASHGHHFGRVEAIAKVEEAFRSLDLKDAAVREVIRLGPSARSLFEGAKARPYPGSTE